MKKGSILEVTYLLTVRWVAKLLTLLILKCWIEAFHQANHRLVTIFFPDSSTLQLATHSPINTTVMVGNSTPHPGTNVTAVGLCKSVCMYLRVLGCGLCVSAGWEWASSSDLQMIVNWLEGTKPRRISHIWVIGPLSTLQSHTYTLRL